MASFWDNPAIHKTLIKCGVNLLFVILLTTVWTILYEVRNLDLFKDNLSI